jgi:elongation factor G
MTSRSNLPRVAALVGPYGSGKTTLMESFLVQCGALGRKGSVDHGSSVGDASPEARRSKMGVDLNIAAASYLGDRWIFLDCPGSIEFQQDSQNALMVCDVAVVVAEPEPDRAIMLAPLLRLLDSRSIPHILFVNKVEAPKARLAETLTAIQELSERKLLLREAPISSEAGITGYIDLISERAYRYRDHQSSEPIATPDAAKPGSGMARQELLENLADLDDHLLEELLSDIVPERDEIYRLLAQDLDGDLIVPVFFGSAAQDYGVRRLLKALRHDVAGVETTRRRLGIGDSGDAMARIFKTQHAAHTGKLSSPASGAAVSPKARRSTASGRPASISPMAAAWSRARPPAPARSPLSAGWRPPAPATASAAATAPIGPSRCRRCSRWHCCRNASRTTSN